MSYETLNEMLESIGIGYSYYAFTKETAIPPPYICFYYPDIDDLYADNSNYQRIVLLRIELYTAEKDFASEQKVEDALANYGLTYDKTELYIESQNQFEIVYESEVVING